MMDVNGNLLSSFTQMRASTFNPILIGRCLIAFPAVGFVVWIVAFISQRRGSKEFLDKLFKSREFSKYSSAQCVYNCLNLLFLINLLFGISSIVRGTGWIDGCKDLDLCTVSGQMFDATRSLSIIINLVVSLVSMFHLSYPRQGPRYMFVEVALSSIIVAVVLSSLYEPSIKFIFEPAVVFPLTLMIGIMSRAPVTTPSWAFKKKLITSVSYVSSLAIFLPSFIVECLIHSGRSDLSVTRLNVLFYSSFNVIVDGVLCALILSLASEEQQQQQQQQEHPPRWQIPLPELKQPSPPWQQPAPQWQQGPQQWQQRSQRWQQPSPQW